MKPFAAFIDVRYLGFYGIINNRGEAGTHPLNAICTASPTLRGFSNPGLQTASSPGCHYSDTPPVTRVQGTEDHAPKVWRPRPGSLSYSAAFSKQASPATNKKHPPKLLVIVGIEQPQPNEGHAGSARGDSPPTSAGAAVQGSEPLPEGNSRALCNTEFQHPPTDHRPAPTPERRLPADRSALTSRRLPAGSDLSCLLRYRGGLRGSQRRDPIR